jgi:DNA polymerase I-like protein with 3'-5' exonuclease and polymerase domains
MDLLEALVEAEITGVTVDTVQLEKLSEKYSEQAANYEKKFSEYEEVMRLESRLKFEELDKEVEKLRKKVSKSAASVAKAKEKVENAKTEAGRKTAQKRVDAAESKRKEAATELADKLEEANTHKQLAEGNDSQLQIYYGIDGNDIELVNMKSTQQMGVLLFDVCGVTGGKKSKKTGFPSVNEKALKAIDHPIAELVLRHRHVSKMVSNYLAGTRDKIDPKRNVVHNSFKINGAVSGRLSSGFHTIPAHGEDSILKSLYVSSTLGGFIIAADLSQIELRIAADIANDEVMIKGFNDGIDLHQLTTDRLNQAVSANKYDRQVGKQTNFAMIYDCSPRGLQAQGIAADEDEGSLFIKTFFSLYQGIKGYMDYMKSSVHKNKMVWSRLGRLRDLRFIYQLADWKAVKQGINFPVQSEASEYTNLVICRLFQTLREYGFTSRVLGGVHDSVILDAECHEVSKVIRLVKREFESASFAPYFPNHKLKVPITIDVKVGRNMWDGKELKSWHYEDLSPESMDFLCRLEISKKDYEKMLTQEQYYDMMRKGITNYKTFLS